MNTFRDDFKLNGHCEKCSTHVGDKTVEWSMYKFGRIFCYEHQPMNVADITKKWAKKYENN